MTEVDKFELNENVKNSGEVSDGYHTFNELYEHRNLLFIALCMQVTEDCYFVKDHFEGWDIVLFDSAPGQISYHIPAKYRYLYAHRIEEKSKNAHTWDGHTPSDVIKRLESFAQEGIWRTK